MALELRNAKDKAAFRRQHESQLILYEAAAKALKEAGVTKLPNLYALKTEYKKLDAEILTPPRPAFSRRLPFCIYRTESPVCTEY